MPAASSSRRKPSRRQNSEEIEEDGEMQPRRNGRVESDEEAPRGSRRTKNTQKTTQGGTQNSDGEENDTDDDDAGEQIDVAKLKDQPLPQTAAGNLSGLVEDWQNIDRVTRNQWAMVQGIAAAIAESTDEADADQPIARLDEIMRELIDLGAEMQANASVIDNLKQMVARGERIDNVVDRYQDEARAKKEAYHGKSTRQKYAKHDAYMEFKSGIWQMQHPDAAMPPLTNFIPKEDGDKSDDDDDLEIGGQIQDFKCPITLTPLVDPLTSMLCGHSYDANALRSMLRGDIKDCPASGCRKKISIADCKADPELAKKAKSYARRIARQEEDEHSEAEEVIE